MTDCGSAPSCSNPPSGSTVDAVCDALGPPAAWLFYFGVPSIAAAKSAIETGGGKVLTGPHEVPGGEWIVTATDPQGASFGVVGPRGV